MAVCPFQITERCWVRPANDQALTALGEVPGPAQLPRNVGGGGRKKNMERAKWGAREAEEESSGRERERKRRTFRVTISEVSS